MRGFVRAFSGLFILSSFLLLPTAASAQERQVVITQGADYFGSDYTVLREVELEACEAACRDDDQCQAFTYNTSARWCFLKEGVGELRAVEGAVSGRIVTAAELTVDVEAERIAELDFLSQTLIDEARRLVGRLEDAQSTGVGVGSAMASAEEAASQSDYLRAAEAYRAALRLAPQGCELWAAYTQAAMNASSDDWQVQQQLGSDRVSGAVNAYLRAVTPEERARALTQLGWSLADRYEWKPAIRAYRASLALVENEATRFTYDQLLEEHGFRIVDHVVEADSAAPRICLNFSDRLAEGQNISDYVSVEGGADLAIEASGQQICVDGVRHGDRYRVTAREGLPAADGESLAKSVTLDIFVRDRAPSARFLGNAYVLPAGGEPTIPLVTVNTDRVDATLYRIGDRQLADAMADGTFLSQLSTWETDNIERRSGIKVWEGTVDVADELNREMTTAIPVGDLESELEPGAYVLTARAVNDTGNEWEARATQWFVVTDLGLTTLNGNDGLHVMVRSLGTAGPVGDVDLRLVAVNNEVLGEATTDAAGYARFAPGLMRGTGGMAPGLLVADRAGGDYGFLDLSKAPMDLTDRGVEGREPPKPLDVFLTTERGIYRAGETIYATTLVRDATANAVADVPLTAIVTRPDGKEASRVALADQGLGGNVTPIEMTAEAMRGTWRVAVHADVDAAPLAETTFLVEDFEPERLDFDLSTAAEALDPAAPADLSVDARFLYGAPASDLSVEGEAVVKASRNVADYPGYFFGLAEDPFNSTIEPLSGATTDEAGHAVLPVALPDSIVSSRPLEATVNVRVLDSGGRPVERNLSLPVASETDRLGIRPLFEGAASENGPVAFELIAVGSDGPRVAERDVRWSLYQVRTQFQWYRSDGRWSYERIETQSRVANGTADISAEATARIEAEVEWGSYRLEVESSAGALPASFDFEAGWYVEASALDTPEALKVSLDKELYAPGETANVHIETRFDGVALVMVVDDRLITTVPVEVTGNEADVELPVTRDWGPGAYVTAALYRPMDLEAKRMPARAIGLTWAGVDPGERDLDVAIEAPDEMRPRQDMPVEVTLAHLPAGTEAYVTLAAVDLGILNLTRYETPDPETYYFGQRRLGVAIRDLYDQLIDRMQGVRGTVRSGGDASFAEFEGEAPTETLMAFHSGVVKVGDDGTASISVPVPDFNGTVRLMAMAWTADGVGHAERDVLVRDPVVVTASLPHFLAPGDRSRLALDLASVEDVAGEMTLSVSARNGSVSVAAGSAGGAIELAAGEREQVLVPITGETVGADVLEVALTLPDGTTLEKSVGIDVRLNEPPVATTDFITLQPGSELTVGADRFTGLVPGTASIQVSASGAGRLNVPAILRALDRYPYGCTEQITSRAMPLVYLNDVAVTAGLGTDPEIRERVEKAITRVLANQSGSGGFGLWGPGGSEDLWLDSYVTDFLTRADQNGFPVPAQPLQLALDNLKNRIAYAGDFDHGGEDIAYALYVLAANGRAAIGDLRYYAEAKLDAFATPLAKAQIGAALALYGDQLRADAVFRAALGSLGVEQESEGGWRIDYGTPLRDGAAVLTLASEARAGIDLISLSSEVERDRQSKRYTSTQEDAWSLLAAHALMQRLSEPSLVVDGEPIVGRLFRSFEADGLEDAPLVIANAGDRGVEIGTTVRGVPAVPEPAGGNFYRLARSYYTLDGQPANLAAIEQGARLVAVFDVITNESEGARLVLDDPLPAGFEIDNPHILSSGDVGTLDWLNLMDNPAHVEFRADRFIAAWDSQPGGATQFQFAYIVRATSPGEFLHPAALVEDMYRPERRSRTDTGSVEVIGPLR
jgi:uncharacterized protein YfaS (alpha-2-macroglobulin family)